MSGGRIEVWPFLRHRREARQHLLEVGRVKLNRRLRRILARYDAAFKAALPLDDGSEFAVEVSGCVGECGKDEQLFVAVVEWRGGFADDDFP